MSSRLGGEKMKIVHVEDFFHPDAGYQVNLLSKLQVAEGHAVSVVTAELEKIPPHLLEFFGSSDIAEKDSRFRQDTDVEIVRLPLLGFYSGRAIFAPLALFKKVRSLKPDIVYVHGEDTLTGILFIILSRWLPYPIVLDSHMLEMASVNSFRSWFRFFYRHLIAPIILRRKISLMRVQDSNYVEKHLGIPLAHTSLLSLGTDTSHFAPNAEARRSTRARLGIDDGDFVVVYAGKLDESKGGLFLAQAIREKLEGKTGRPITFLIVGNVVGEYGAAVEALLHESENRIIRLPTQRYLDLAAVYQCADLAIFPRQCSLSFFDVQAAGVPVLFEENEINVQRAGQGNAFLFPPGSVQGFREEVEELAGMSKDAHQQASVNARKYVLANYDYVPIAKKVTGILEDALHSWQR